MPIKITNLPAEDTPTDDDLVVLRDNTTGTTRKVTRTKFFENPPIGNNAIDTDMIADGAVTKVKLGGDAKISVRLYSVASPSTLTPNVNDYDIFAITNLNTTLTVAAPTGTPVDGQGLMFRFKDNGTTQNMTFNAIYRAIGVTIPTSTVASKMLYISARYNAAALKWDVLSIGREA